MTDSGVAWLRDRVQARLAAAEAACGDIEGGGTWLTGDFPYGRAIVRDSLGSVVVYDEGEPSEAEAAHIAVNDPRDVIARCEAELAILDAYETAARMAEADDTRWRAGEVFGLRGAVVMLADAYRYQEGWEKHWGEGG